MRYTNTPATVYNAWKDPVTNRTVYRPTVLRDVKWQGTRASRLTATGIAPGDAVGTLTTVIIWPSRLVDTQGRRYIEPKDYARLGPDDVDDYWTLSDDGDRLVRGAVNDLAVIEKIQDVVAHCDSVVKVSSVMDNRFGPARLQHWYVAGAGG